MFVMKNSIPVAISVTEHGYLEHVEIGTNGIGVCKEAPTRDYLFSVGYDEIGQINSMEDLPDFLAKFFNKETPAAEIPEKPKIVSVGEIFNRPGNLDQPLDAAKKFWWQT